MQHPTPPFTPQEYLALENTSATHRMPRDIASAATRGLSIQFRAATSTPSDLRPGSLRLFSARAQCCSVPGKALDELQLTHQQSRTEFIARDEALRLQIQRSCSAVTVNVIRNCVHVMLRGHFSLPALHSSRHANIQSLPAPAQCFIIEMIVRKRTRTSTPGSTTFFCCENQRSRSRSSCVFDSYNLKDATAILGVSQIYAGQLNSFRRAVPAKI
jgi:hypothetical protein